MTGRLFVFSCGRHLTEIARARATRLKQNVTTLIGEIYLRGTAQNMAVLFFSEKSQNNFPGIKFRRLYNNVR